MHAKIKRADVLKIATPVHILLPGKMQIFINLLFPMVYPYLEYKDGGTRARLHDDAGIIKIVLVSTGGWYEKENFDNVVYILQKNLH